MSLAVDHLTAPPATAPIDFPRLDATLANLRRAERDVATMSAYLAEARDALAAKPDYPEAARAARMAGLRMRGDALALSQSLAALAWSEA